MKLFVGVGNPGAKYAGNRHNIGFMALDRIAGDHGFAPWRARFQGQVAEGRLGEARVVLLKPETFMNLSGQAVGEAMRFHKILPSDVVAFHDELDLAPGRVRCKTGGGHAGHNGLRSIHAHIGEGYDRVRMGIGHPGCKELVSGYVLHDFAKADGEWLDDVLRGVSDGAEALAAGDSARFLNAVALRVAPARSGTGQGAASGGKKAKPVDRPAGEGRAPERADAAGAAHVQQAPETLPVETPDSRGLLQRLADRFK